MISRETLRLSARVPYQSFNIGSERKKCLPLTLSATFRPSQPFLIPPEAPNKPLNNHLGRKKIHLSASRVRYLLTRHGSIHKQFEVVECPYKNVKTYPKLLAKITRFIVDV